MSIEFPTAVDLVDHHCHGPSPVDLDRDGFELMISESGVPAPAGTSHFDTPVGLALRAVCPPLLDLEPFCDPSDYIRRRRELGAKEVNERFLRAAGCARWLVDTGHRSDDILDPPEMTAVSGVRAEEVVRIEAVAEAVAAQGPTAAGYADAFASELQARLAGAAGLKSILGYRGGFGIDPTPPSAKDVEAAAGAWLAASAGGTPRLEDPVLLRHALWTGAELARDRGACPIQFHVGFGDPDVRIHQNDPTLLTDFLLALNEIGVVATLLHCYPYHRQAGYLSEVLPNVYFDVGVILNYTGPSARRILAEALELAPFTKQLYSSDAFGVAEFHYMQAHLFRRHLGAILDDWCTEGMCNHREADRIMRMIAHVNAERIYPN